MDFRVDEQFAEVFEFEGALDWMTHHLDQLFVGTKNLMSFFLLAWKVTYNIVCIVHVKELLPSQLSRRLTDQLK